MAKKEKTKESETSTPAKLPIVVKKTRPVRLIPHQCGGYAYGIFTLEPAKVFNIDGDQDESLLFNAARSGVIVVERAGIWSEKTGDDIKVELIHPSDGSKDIAIVLSGGFHRAVVSTSKVPKTYLHSGADINLKISSSNGSSFSVMFIEE